MDASSSTSTPHEAMPNMSASPSETPSTDGINQEPHMCWPPPTLLAGQSLNLPFQQRATNPLLAFTCLQEKYKQDFQTRYGLQNNPFSPGSSSSQEQRISATLRTLHHVQQTLQQRHQDAQMQLARTEKLIQQTSWDLFFQSPLDFMCHEMDIFAGGGGRSSSDNAQSLPESEAWMKKLDDLRDLQDEECAVRKRMEKTVRQMRRTEEMMVVGGLKLQGSSSPFAFGGQYGVVLPHRFPAVQTMAFPAGVNTAGLEASDMPSMFSNWPQPAAQDEGSINAVDDSSTGSSSHFEASCGPDCCHRAQ
ncbi:hypothetical protein ACQKWADRAFT_253122 [Trichoderma austrokoningii]